MNRRLTETHAAVTSFFMDELVKAQPEAVQLFLSAAALFDLFSTALLDAALLGTPDMPPARTLLDRSMRDQLLIYPLDNEQGWYRCHDLMRDLLNDELSSPLSLDAAQRMRCLGADWLSQNGYVEEALGQYLAAGDEEAASTLLMRHMGAVVEEEVSRRTLDRYIAMFSETARKENVVVIAAQIYRRAQHWD